MIMMIMMMCMVMIIIIVMDDYDIFEKKLIPGKPGIVIPNQYRSKRVI
jgi:hypothetical protein